jgi:hypothetical protein
MALRDLAIVRLLFHRGLRINEALSLDLEHWTPTIDSDVVVKFSWGTPTECCVDWGLVGLGAFSQSSTKPREAFLLSSHCPLGAGGGPLRRQPRPAGGWRSVSP